MTQNLLREQFSKEDLLNDHLLNETFQRESLKKLLNEKREVITESMSRLIGSKIDIIIRKLLSKEFTDNIRNFSIAHILTVRRYLLLVIENI